MMRYFYTTSRAHHAYCMALDFGMEFEQRFDQKWTMERLLSLQGVKDYKIYVHPDSLHLLEPQIGDVIEFYYPESDDKQVVMVTDDHSDSAVYEQGLSIKYIHEITDPDIIQRNGIAFHWPESEESQPNDSQRQQQKHHPE